MILYKWRNFIKCAEKWNSTEALITSGEPVKNHGWRLVPGFFSLVKDYGEAKSETGKKKKQREDSGGEELDKTVCQARCNTESLYTSFWTWCSWKLLI